MQDDSITVRLRLPGLKVLDVEEGPRWIEVAAQCREEEMACPRCGVKRERERAPQASRFAISLTPLVAFATIPSAGDWLSWTEHSVTGPQAKWGTNHAPRSASGWFVHRHRPSGPRYPQRTIG